MKRDDLLRMRGAIAASMVVVFLWAHYFGTPAPPPAKPDVSSAPAPAGPDAPPAGQPGGPAAPAAPAAIQAAPPPVSAEAVVGDANARRTIKTRQHEVDLSARGGRIWSWKLLEFRRVPASPESGVVELV